MVYELSHPYWLHVQILIKNPCLIGQESKVCCYWSQVLLLLLMKGEANYSWWVFLHFQFVNQTSQLNLTCEYSISFAVIALNTSTVTKDDSKLSESSSTLGSLNTFFLQHLQMILKLMQFIDCPWSNPASILMLAKSVIFINGAFLMADLNKESDSMH